MEIKFEPYKQHSVFGSYFNKKNNARKCKRPIEREHVREEDEIKDMA